MKNQETARRLKEAMALAGVTAKELYERSGVSQSSISQYCHGTYVPTNVSAAKMAEVLKVSPVWLMGFDVPMLIEESPTESNAMRRMVAYWAALAPLDQVEAVAALIKSLKKEE